MMKIPYEPQHPVASVIDRRRFLHGIGAAAAGVAGVAALGPVEGIARQASAQPQTVPNSFSRMFEGLPPFAEPSSRMNRALLELGRPGGLMDAKDPLAEGPIRLITIPGNSDNNKDSTTSTAGVTFVGQFLDHDMTFDTTSPLGVPTPPETARNRRTPALDLDSVYGRGPVANPQFYDPSDPAKFLVESGGQFEDLPRRRDGRAIIPDPRNDENLMIAGLQAAFLLFHNRVVDRLRSDDSLTPEAERQTETELESLTNAGDSARRANVFNAARRLVTRHYHWMILHEFLPSIIGAGVVNDILLNGCRFYNPQPGGQRMPVEFQGAAYRFGHSLVRPSYRANLAGDAGGQPFFGMIFDPAGEGQSDPVDLRGGSRASRRFIGWQTFFNFGGDQAANVRPNKVIDTKISTPLFHLPLGSIASGDPPTSLAQRNLLRHLTWSVPSGQDIARAMNIPVLSTNQLSQLRRYDVGLERSTPLWYYILKEAEVAGGGLLAGVGARIVGEVIITLLRLTPNSYLTENPRWRPNLPSRVPGTFGMVDLLTFAGVDPASRKQ
jgi:hypothetical protein